MTIKTVPSESDLRAANRVFDELARSEYGVSVDELVGHLDSANSNELLQFGRLIGVLVKQPFATRIDFPERSPFSGAFHGWDIDRAQLDNPKKWQSWQYKTLEQTALSFPGIQNPDDLLAQTHSERGLWAYIANSFGNYICGASPELDKTIREQLNAVKLSPEGLYGTAGIALATALLTAIPPLTGLIAVGAAPILYGFMVILSRIGIDGFCKWRHSLLNSFAPGEGS
jgi:hypothetical protein